MWIIVLILALPLVDIASFVVVGPRLGVAGTLLLVFASMSGGVLLLRHIGWRTLERLHGSVLAGGDPFPETLDSALLAAAAILLIIPGFASDFLAFLLLLPPLRELAVARIMRWLKHRGSGLTSRSATGVIDVEFHEIDE